MNTKYFLSVMTAAMLSYGCSVPVTTFDRVKKIDGLEVRATCEIPMCGEGNRKVTITGKEFYQGRNESVFFTERVYKLESIITIWMEIPPGSPLEKMEIKQIKQFYESAEKKEEGWKDIKEE